MSEKFKFITNTTENPLFEYISFDELSDFKSSPSVGTPLQIYFCAKGEGFFVINNEKHVIKEGDIFIQNPEAFVGIQVEKTKTLSYFGIGVPGKKIDFVGNNVFCLLSPGIQSFYFTLLNRIFELISNEETKTNSLINEYFAILFKELLLYVDLSSSSVSFKAKSELVYRALEYIDFNFIKKITIRDMCNFLMCSESSLLHDFKKETGKTVIEYILEKKLDLAKYTIRNTTKTINEISDNVGFSSPQFFYKYFFKKEGMTPIDYRKKYYK